MMRHVQGIVCAIVVLAVSSLRAGAQTAGLRVIDGFEDAAAWTVVAADGVGIHTSTEMGKVGRCLRIDYDFTRGSGYGIIRKEVRLPLGANYAFGYWVRGEGPRNTIEFKLLDPSGDNVWWVNQRNTEFPREWKRVVLPKRKFSFAWGPSGGKPIEEARTIEIAITSFNGGKGTVWLDELGFEELPEVRAYTGTMRAKGSSGRIEHAEIGARGEVGWSPRADEAAPNLTVDFGAARDFGGVVIEWEADAPSEYAVLGSVDGRVFVPLAAVRGSRGGKDYVQTPDATARAIRIACAAGAARAQGHGVSLRSLQVMEPVFGESGNELIRVVAAEAPRGQYPRSFTGEAVYWTVVGVNGDDREALVSEDGAVEVDKLGFSLEPFVIDDGETQSWANTTSSQRLEDGYLPIPTVRRTGAGVELDITAFMDGDPGRSVLWIRYSVKNTGSSRRTIRLAIAARPFQVNPPYQNLNITGGMSAISRIEPGRVGGVMEVDEWMVVPMTTPEGISVGTFDSSHAGEGTIPARYVTEPVVDPRALASAAMWYAFDLDPGASAAVGVAVPARAEDGAGLIQEGMSGLERRLDSAKAFWHHSLDQVSISFPKGCERIAESVKANLAYILINRDGPAIQPGSRCYERTWIRDGSLTSTALLALGHADEVREFLDWFGPHQYESGKVPCCVDRRGSDPVPENDSHGEYIYAVRTYTEFTGDEAFARRHWARVLGAVRYIEFLRAQRLTPEYRDGPTEKRVCYGLVPESISHEGYSAKAMHSYWDDFWTLKGLIDGAALAERLGEAAEAARIGALRDDFQKTLDASLRLAMQMKGIDYLPGCAELGDFDATSTTVALFPCGLGAMLPDGALGATFEKYWAFFKDRRDGRLAWKDYTPYEHRVAGAMVMLGWRERAREVQEFFFNDQRPAGWREWAEVVRRDPREPGYIGDMPHTWVGSDFINSVVLMLAYVREKDGALVIGAGLTRAWIETEEGVSVGGLRTVYGPLRYSVRKKGDAVVYEIGAMSRVPRGGLVVSVAEPGEVESVRVNGQIVQMGEGGNVGVVEAPAVVEVRYRAAR